jgi:hypothetical protein
MDDNKLYPVVDGQVFNLQSSIPSEGYDCQNGYANHNQAIGIALLMSKKVYTPYKSYKAASIGNTNLANGKASYVLADGSFDGNVNYSRMHSDYRTASPANEFPMVLKSGTTEKLIPAERGSNYYFMTRYYVDNNFIIETKVANRACVIIPIDE